MRKQNPKEPLMLEWKKDWNSPQQNQSNLPQSSTTGTGEGFAVSPQQPATGFAFPQESAENSKAINSLNKILSEQNLSETIEQYSRAEWTTFERLFMQEFRMSIKTDIFALSNPEIKEQYKIKLNNFLTRLKDSMQNTEVKNEIQKFMDEIPTI
jgi:glutaredoxin-related protein